MSKEEDGLILPTYVQDHSNIRVFLTVAPITRISICYYYPRPKFGRTTGRVV